MHSICGWRCTLREAQVLPFSIESSAAVVELYWLKGSGKYQTIRDGELGPVMIGYDYVLFSDELAEWLKTLDLEGTRFEPTIIWNRKRGIERANYKKAPINSHFSHENINDINLKGRRFLIMENRYLFASPELHEILVSEKPELFITSVGLSRFG